jgi:hypothetical protein
MATIMQYTFQIGLKKKKLMCNKEIFVESAAMNYVLRKFRVDEK